MYHLRLKGTHYEAGFKRGSLFKKNKVVFSIHLDEFQKQFGEASGKILNTVFPEGYQEVLGISDALGVNHTEFLSWMMCMGSCMYNLADNKPLEVRGCTAMAFTHNGQVYYARNNDLPPYLKAGSKAELYKLDRTPNFYMTTSSFVNGEEGVNEFGLVVAMTFVLPYIDEIKPGLNSVFIVRYVLERAKDVQQAKKLLKEIPIASSCNILLVDKNQTMVVAECHPNKVHFREAEVNKYGNKLLVTTNEFTSKQMKKYMKDGDTYHANERYQVATKALAELSPKVDVYTYTQDILRGRYGFMCQYETIPNFETIWSTIVNVNSKMIYRAEGDPRRKKFIEDSRLAKIR